MPLNGYIITNDETDFNEANHQELFDKHEQSQEIAEIMGRDYFNIFYTLSNLAKEKQKPDIYKLLFDRSHKNDMYYGYLTIEEQKNCKEFLEFLDKNSLIIDAINKKYEEKISATFKSLHSTLTKPDEFDVSHELDRAEFSVKESLADMERELTSLQYKAISSKINNISEDTFFKSLIRLLEYSISKNLVLIARWDS